VQAILERAVPLVVRKLREIEEIPGRMANVIRMDEFKQKILNGEGRRALDMVVDR